MKRNLGKRFNALLSLVVFLATLEIAARVDDWIQYDAPLFSRYTPDLLRTTDTEGVRRNVPGSHFEKWRINRSGFRGPEISLNKVEGVIRIVCMGTSETFGLFESAGKEWPAQLKEMLESIGRFEVINTSVVGLVLKDYQPYLERYVLMFDPEIVILCVNPFYYGTEGEAGFGGTVAETGRTKKEVASGFLSIKTMLQNCRIFSKLKEASKSVIPEYLYKTYKLWSMRRQVDRLERTRLNGKKPADVASNESMNNLYRDLKGLVEFLKRRKIEVILCSYPALISKENINDYLEIFLDHRRFSIGLSLKGSLDCLIKGNGVIKRVAEESAAGYVDLESAIPKRAEFYGDNVHYTDKGAKIIATEFLNFLTEETSLRTTTSHVSR